MIAEKLTAWLPKERASGVGISADDLKGLALAHDLKADILAAINSNVGADIRLGLFFAEHLVRPGLDVQFEHELVEASLKQLKSNEWGVKEGCLSLLVQFGQRLNSYRELMLNALHDCDPLVRKKALAAYGTFSRPKEFEPLEPFENDNYVIEVGMGSHLVYDLRNQALETIEHSVSRNFSKSERTQVLANGAVVFWWDWTPFHEWKKSWLRKIIG